MKTTFIAITIALITPFVTLGQKTQKLKQLNVGDTMPDLEIKDVINFKSSTIRISEFKGKLMILDFWGTWCTPCIASFRKLDTLQKKFGKDIQILPVTSEEKSKVSDFLAKLKKSLSILPASITNDSILSRLFFHSSVPHYVWIDGTGKVIAVTGNEDVNERNIQSYLKGTPLSYQLKKEDEGSMVAILVAGIKEVSNSGGRMELYKFPDTLLLYTSILSRYVEDWGSGASFEDSTYVLVRNRSLKGLYQVALMGNSFSGLINDNVIIEIPDSTLYRILQDQRPDGSQPTDRLEILAWKREHYYTYKCKVTPQQAKRRFNIMLAELNRYFGELYGVEGVLETRKNKCLALTKLSSDDRIRSMGGETIIKSDIFSIKLRNAKIKNLLSRLRFPLQKYPILVNETDYIGEIDIDIKCNLTDLEAVNRELEKYDLQLIEKEKEMPVPIIRMKRD